MKDLGQKLKEFRQARGLTQTELAKLCGLSHKNVISSYERGRETPSLSKTLPIICKVLGVNLEIILTSKKK